MGLLIDEKTHWSGVSLAADKNGDPIEVRYFKSMGLFLTWADASATDAVVKLQFSFDGTNFYDISGATQTIGAASGSKLFEIATLAYPYLRVVLTKNTETTGTATIKFIMRGI